MPTHGRWHSKDMRAHVGDTLRLHGRTVGDPDRVGTITAVLGEAGSPPYRVRFDPNVDTVIMPGPDATVEPPTKPSPA